MAVHRHEWLTQVLRRMRLLSVTCVWFKKKKKNSRRWNSKDTFARNQRVESLRTITAGGVPCPAVDRLMTMNDDDSEFDETRANSNCRFSSESFYVCSGRVCLARDRFRKQMLSLQNAPDRKNRQQVSRNKSNFSPVQKCSPIAKEQKPCVATAISKCGPGGVSRLFRSQRWETHFVTSSTLIRGRIAFAAEASLQKDREKDE